MTTRKPTLTLIKELREILSFPSTIVSYGKEQMRESAERMEELHELLSKCLPHVQASAQAEHILDGFGPRHELPIDVLVQKVKTALK